MRTGFLLRTLFASLALTASACCTQVPLTPCNPLPPCHARNAILAPVIVWGDTYVAPFPNPRDAKPVKITARKPAPKVVRNLPSVPPEPETQVATVSHEEPAKKQEPPTAKSPAAEPAPLPAVTPRHRCVPGCRCGCTCGHR